MIKNTDSKESIQHFFKKLTNKFSAEELRKMADFITNKL